MKNRKGFVISTMLYSMFGIMMIIVFYILYLLVNNRMFIMTSIDELKSNIEGSNKTEVEEENIYINFLISKGLESEYTQEKINEILKETEDQMHGYNIDSNVQYTSYDAEKTYLATRNETKYTYPSCVPGNTHLIYSYQGVLGNYILFSNRKAVPDLVLKDIKTNNNINLIDSISQTDFYGESPSVSYRIDSVNNYLYAKIYTSGAYYQSSACWIRNRNSTHYLRIKYNPENNYELGEVESAKLVIENGCYYTRQISKSQNYASFESAYNSLSTSNFSGNNLTYPSNYTEIFTAMQTIKQNEYTGASKYKKGVYTNPEYDSYKNVFYNSETEEKGILIVELTPDFYTGVQCNLGEERGVMDIIWYRNVTYTGETLDSVSDIPVGNNYKKTFNIIIKKDDNRDIAGANHFTVGNNVKTNTQSYDQVITYTETLSENIIKNKLGTDNKYIYSKYNSDYSKMKNIIKTDIVNSL